MKIKELLEYGKNNLIEKEDAYRLSKMLLKYLLKVEKTYIVINSEEEIANNIVLEFKKNIQLLNSGMPIQYITNCQEFMGLKFYVDENVLIPQPDTEILVEEMIEKIKKTSKKSIKILDLCTGSGAIGVSFAKIIGNSNVYMSDISERALEIAKKNAIQNDVINKCQFILSDLFADINEQFDIIVSNPPYIETRVILTLSNQVQKEPILALDGGKDGLDFYRIIADNAYLHLNKSGILAMEIGYNQKDAVMEILERTKKYTDISCKKDLGGNDRVVICSLK